MTTITPPIPPPGAQDATPFLAMVLSEMLELRAASAVHDLFLRDLLEKVNGETEAEILEYQQVSMKAARRRLYKDVEETMQRLFPNHLRMVQTLFREV
jgi:hypothetical protein